MENQKTQITLYEMRKWWVKKAKWYHRGEGHFNTELYLRICEAKQRREIALN
jgi:hypothetical protein